MIYSKLASKFIIFEAGLLHTKSVLIDNKLALVGTVNMEFTQFLLNFEITVAVEDRNFANEVATLHENYLANSSALDMQEWINRPFYHRIIERLFFLFSPLSNFHNKYKKGVPHSTPFLFSRLCLTFFHDKH